MDFIKGIVMLVKAYKMCNILKSLLANRYWSRDKDGSRWSKFSLEPALQCSSVFFYWFSHLLNDRLHLPVPISYYFFHNNQLINVAWSVDVLNLSLKSTPLSKEALVLVMFEWRFHVTFLWDISKKLRARLVF